MQTLYLRATDQQHMCATDTGGNHCLLVCDLLEAENCLSWVRVSAHWHLWEPYAEGVVPCDGTTTSDERIV